jgi:hypothetical protein
VRPLPLWRKELRELRPWGLLSALLGASEPLTDLARQVDMLPLSSRFSYVVGIGLYPAWMLAFAVGMGLAVRERDDGTQGFLDGLPVRRSTVFATRVLVAVAVVSLAPVVGASSSLVLHLLSRGSLDHAVHPGLLLGGLGLGLLLMLSGVLTGAALGGLRSLAWLAAGTLATGLTLLIDRVPRAAVLNPLALCDVTVDSRGLVVDAALVWAQGGLCVISALIAWRVFDGGSGARLRTLAARPVVGALVTALTLVAGVALMVSLRPGEAVPNSASGPTFAPGAPAQTQTAHYRFSYPAKRSRPVLALAAQADAIFERVHALLNLSPGERVDVDASGSQRNTAGTAFSNGLRLDADAEDLTAVLAHETTHVVARRLAGGDRAHLWAKASVLNEGLATWVARAFERDSPERDEGRLVLAALQQRQELPLRAFAEVTVLAERDELLKYQAGEAVIEAVVQVAGAEALPRVLKAFADETLPQDLEGLELWRVVFQKAGVDLSVVLDAVARSLAGEARARAKVLSTLPRPRVRLVQAHGRLGARALLDGPLPPGWGLALRFKPAPSSPPSRFDRVAVDPEEIAWREPETIRAGRVCVQAGVTTPRHIALFEPWSCEAADGAEALPDPTDAVVARLSLVRPDAVFARPSHVDAPHEGDFGAVAAGAWGPLAALSTEWLQLPPAKACFAALQDGTVAALESPCSAVLARALPHAQLVAEAVRAVRAGSPGGLHWTQRQDPGDAPTGPRMAARALLYDADVALERGDVAAAGARCLDVLALARDLEWGGDGPLTGQAVGLDALVMPLCLRVAARQPALLRAGVARVAAGLAPTHHVLALERLRAVALDFGPSVPDAHRGALPPAVRAALAGGDGEAASEDQWDAREATWEDLFGATDDAQALALASRFDESSAEVESVLRAHACRAGLLAMLSGAAAPSLTVSRGDGGTVTLEVHCGVREDSYEATVHGTDVRWLVAEPH